MKESGALIAALLVFGNCVKMRPKPPKAVIKEAMIVGLKMEMPGASLLSAPASTCPPLPATWSPCPKKCPAMTLTIVKIRPATRQIP